MGLLLLLLIILIAYKVYTGSGKPGTTYIDPLAQRNEEWVSFIASYKNTVKTAAEKALIARMLTDIKKQGLSAKLDIVEPAFEHEPVVSSPHTKTQTAPLHVTTAHTQPAQATLSVQEPLDNTTMLLYFGAFLFVASIGLFISFGGATGWLKTAAVALVMFVLYSSGIWLYRNKTKLKPAGLAFAGIGMSIAPLVGLAAYTYIFKDQARGVWFLTSILCMGMYLHALVTIRKPLVSYIFIFTLLSLFESGVSIINVPIYYFGWAMALTGMLLQIASLMKGFWPDLREPSRQSSQLFVPLSIIISFYLVQSQGLTQLGISLLLGGLFYGLEAFNSTAGERQNNAVASHVALLAGLVCLVFASTNNWTTTAIALVVINAVQILGLWFISKQDDLSTNYATIILVASGTSILFALENPKAILATTSSLVLFGALIWLRQKRDDAYACMALASIALPLIYGQLVASPHLSATSQTALLVAGFTIQALLFIQPIKKLGLLRVEDTGRTVLLIHLLFAAGAALFSGPWTSLALLSYLALALVVLAELDHHNEWEVIGGLVMLSTMLPAADNGKNFFTANLLALGFNLGLALRYRQELNRWLSTVLWLALPFGLSRIIPGGLTSAGYAWSYVAVMVALIISRFIARGGVWVSANIPLASYARSMSQAYVFGYVTAAALAIIASLDSEQSQLHTTIIASLMLLTALVIGRYVEKKAEVFTLIPFLAQLAIWSAVRPTAHQPELYLVLSSTIALICYGLGRMNSGKDSYTQQLVVSSLATSYITPLTIFFIPQTWLMPVGSFIAGALTLEYVWQKTQENREAAIIVMVASILWLLLYLGLDELQVHTHIIALTLAGFAYWRHVRQEIETSDSYITAALATATIPLILQALGGTSGDLYGWWLVLEQIAFMIIGISIRKKLVVRWGLYVAIGAVLYQLRELQWAALTVLAVFVIGVAIYRLQKHN